MKLPIDTKSVKVAAAGGGPGRLKSVPGLRANVDFEALVREDMKEMIALPIQKLLVSIPEACRILSVSRSKLYELLCSDLLPSVHIGRSRRIRIKDLEAFVEVSLEP